MGWYIWNKETEKLSPGKKCDYCKEPIKINEKYYILNINPDVVVHAICYWEATEKSGSK